MNRKTIHVGYITRVEGEGSVSLTVANGELQNVQLRIFEPPRFFEGLLQGRLAKEAPDITARVCGICPVAYQMSAVHAIEYLAGIELDEPLRRLRRLLYCGEWIQSHSLHLFMLHLPDFLGYPSLIKMAREYPSLVSQGLLVKKAGNAIVRLLGGREVHPVNVRLGGFYALPDISAFCGLLCELRKAYQEMLNVINLLGGLSYPDMEQDYEFLALNDGKEYPLCQGRIVSSAGLDIPVDDFEESIEEYQVRGSHALYAKRKNAGPYLCGPMARFALNFELLPPVIQNLAWRLGIAGGTRNPYRSIQVRALEIMFALHEAQSIIGSFKVLPHPSIDFNLHSGSARAATEAPRGLLYHRYDLREDGTIMAVRLIPPTSQNQLAMEGDLRAALSEVLDAETSVLEALSERLIRNHDPCISCAAHFLRVKRRSPNASLAQATRI